MSPVALLFAALVLIAFAGLGILLAQRGHERRLGELERRCSALETRVEALEAHVSRPPADLGLASRVAELERELDPASSASPRRAHVLLEMHRKQIEALGRDVGWTDDRARTRLIPKSPVAPSEPPPLPDAEEPAR